MLPLSWRARQFHLTGHVNPEGPTELGEQSFWIECLDKNKLEAWSSGHIFYNPPEYSKERLFLKKLQWWIDQLRMFHRGDAIGIHAAYSTDMASQGDIDNILFYNVGRMESVSRSCPLLRYERLRSIPRSCPVQLREGPVHYYRYLFVPVESDSICEGIHGSNLLEFSTTCESIDVLCGRASVWLAVCRALSKIQSPGPNRARGHYQDHFGVRVALTVPDSMGQNRSFVMKSIFDGVISALSQYIGPDVEEVANRIAGELGVSPEEVQEHLTSSNHKVLGEHRMVAIRGDGVQFRPKDDLCDAGELRLLRPKITHSGSSIVMHGQVFEIA